MSDTKKWIINRFKQDLKKDFRKGIESCLYCAIGNSGILSDLLKALEQMVAMSPEDGIKKDLEYKGFTFNFSEEESKSENFFNAIAYRYQESLLNVYYKNIPSYKALKDIAKKEGFNVVSLDLNFTEKKYREIVEPVFQKYFREYLVKQFSKQWMGYPNKGIQTEIKARKVFKDSPNDLSEKMKKSDLSRGDKVVLSNGLEVVEGEVDNVGSSSTLAIRFKCGFSNFEHFSYLRYYKKDQVFKTSLGTSGGKSLKENSYTVLRKV